MSSCVKVVLTISALRSHAGRKLKCAGVICSAVNTLHGDRPPSTNARTPVQNKTPYKPPLRPQVRPTGPPPSECETPGQRRTAAVDSPCSALCCSAVPLRLGQHLFRAFSGCRPFWVVRIALQALSG